MDFSLDYSLKLKFYGKAQPHWYSWCRHNIINYVLDYFLIFDVALSKHVDKKVLLYLYGLWSCPSWLFYHLTHYNILYTIIHRSLTRTFQHLNVHHKLLKVIKMFVLTPLRLLIFMLHALIIYYTCTIILHIAAYIYICCLR